MNKRYEIGESIGKGGLGAVYKALDTQLQRDVAIKRILSTKNATEEEVKSAGENLLAEAQTLSSLNHPNIVTVFDVGQDDEGGFVVMELLNGETLDDTVERGVLTQEDFTEVVIQTLEALIAAQALNVLHRDLKPPNIMVIWQPSGKFQTKILDFGLAKFSKKPSVQTMDQDDAVMGSIFFMAPEQFERAELDYCSDMYQIGCVYYHSLTGQYPFRGETAPQVMNAHLQHRVTPLEKLRPDLSPSICQWVMWLINRDMENRPSSARQALEYYPKNPEAPAAALPAIVVEPTRATGASTVKIVSAPTHDAAPPSGVVFAKTMTTGVTPVATAIGGATGALQQEDEAHDLEGPAIPVQPPKSHKTVWTLLIITCISIISAISFVVVSKNKNAANQKRFLELSKMEKPTGTAKDVALALNMLMQPDALLAEKIDARKILIGFQSPEVDRQVIEALNETQDSDQFVPLSYILSERNNTQGFPAMLGAFKRIPDGTKADSRRIKILGYIRQTADDSAVPEMMKALGSKHPAAVRGVMEDIVLAVLRKSGNSKTVTSPILARIAETKNTEEQRSLFRILGLLGGNDVQSHLEKDFSNPGDDLGYQLAAMNALLNWQNHDVLPLLEKIATTSKETALRLIALRAYLRVASLPAPLPAAERVSTWEKALTLSEKDFKRLSSDLRQLFASISDYPDAETEAFLNKLAKKPGVEGFVKTSLEVIKNHRKEITTVDKVAELLPENVGFRGDGGAARDLFEGSINSWTSPETWFVWHLKVKQNAAFQVEIEQSTPLDGMTEVFVVAGDQIVTGQSLKTDAFDDYKTVTLKGTLKLEAGKNYALFVRAGNKVQARMMNIKKVRLVRK